MTDASGSDVRIDDKPLTAAELPAVKSFLATDKILAYLPPDGSVADLAEMALSHPERSVVHVWRLASGEIIGVAGLEIHADRNDAQLWVVALDVDVHYWIPTAAAKMLLKVAFVDLRLGCVRAQCLREDRQTTSALRDEHFVADGVQRGNLRWKGAWKDRSLFSVASPDWFAATNPKTTGNRFLQCREEDRGPFYGFMIGQVVLLAALVYLAFVTVGWIGLLLSSVYVAVIFRLDWLLFQRIRHEARFGMRSLTFGFLCAAGFSILILLQTIFRIRWSAGISASWLLVVLVFLALAVFHLAAAKKVADHKAPWLWIGSLLLGLPLWAWMVLSSSAGEWASISIYSQGWSAWTERVAERAKVVAERQQWQGAPAPRVAVALSGGGYRAALIHAGVLAELDRQHVPIRYLTTVSGGSIIGAHYALGYRPGDFIRATWQNKPGLLYSKLGFFQVVSAWLFPWRSDADDYANHFARFYFGKASLHDLPDRPVLIANVTDIEAAPQNAREVIFREGAEQQPDLARSIRVADVVAASGAFPGAFDPKTIPWFPSGSGAVTVPAVPRRFVDGGVVENMGLEGLRQYLRWRRDMKLPLEKPDVLIVSDASRPSMSAPLATKPELADLLARVQDISYSGLQRRLLNQFTGQTDFWRWIESRDWDGMVAEVPYGVIDKDLEAGQPTVLRVIVIPTTSPQMERKLAAVDPARCAFGPRSVGSVQKEVAAFDTLKELPPGDIEKAAWLGSALATLYRNAIQCALQESSGAATACAAPATLPSCRDFSAIAQASR